MASKRTATTELNHDNWNEEQEPEEAGTFARATNDILRKRVVKTARRGNRLLPVEVSIPCSLLFLSIILISVNIMLKQFQESSLKSAFESFKGFSTTPAKSAPFSFLAGVSTSSSATVNTTSATTIVNTSRNIASNGATKITENDTNKTEETVKTQTTLNTGTSKPVSTDQASEKTKNNSSDYYTRLKGLNESVAQWIKSHVDKNPFCILTPIFKDYEKYLKEIVSKEESIKVQTTSQTMEHTTKVAQNDNKKDESAEKKSDSLFGGNANVTTKSPSLAGTEWKPEKSVFSNITPSTKSIFGNAEQKTESPKSLFGSTDTAATSEMRRPIFGNLESNTSGKSIFSNVSAENNPFLQKPSAVSDNKAEEEQAKPDAKSAVPTFSSSTFSFGQSSATSNVSAGFSFGR